MNKPAQLPDTISGKEILHHLREKGLNQVFSNASALINARWQLRGIEQVGSRPRVWGKVNVTNHGMITIGSRLRMRSRIVAVDLFTGPQGLLEIGDEVFINFGCSFAALQNIRIQSRCSIGPYVFIMDNNFHKVEPEQRNLLPESLPVVIEENVWLGARVTVLPGVTIGRDSVIGAGSVVTENIAPRTVAAGIPARVIRTL
jgi:acetyltransferase-like isoleucine patch superfamily enzyme